MLGLCSKSFYWKNVYNFIFFTWKSICYADLLFFLFSVKFRQQVTSKKLLIYSLPFFSDKKGTTLLLPFRTLFRLAARIGDRSFHQTHQIGQLLEGSFLFALFGNLRRLTDIKPPLPFQKLKILLSSVKFDENQNWKTQLQ